MTGFKNSDCGVMIVHSEDDSTIPIRYGYDKYYKKYKDDPRFTFKKYEDRDHGVLTDKDGNLDKSLINAVVSFFNRYVVA